MSSNNIALTALQILDQPIGLTGETGGTMTEVTFDDPVTVTQGMRQNVYNTVTNPGGTVTITALQQDPAYGQLMSLHRRNLAAQGQLNMNGTMILTDGTSVSWSRGRITSLPAMRMEQNATSVTVVLSFDGYVTT